MPLVIDIETLAIPDVDTYLAPVSAPDNYKDPEKIAAYIKDARAKDIERAALDLDLAQIIAVGWWAPGMPDAEVRLAVTLSEADIISEVWTSVRIYGYPIVTYNGLTFDLPMLERRSLYLNLTSAPQIQMDRFKHPAIEDLCARLSKNGQHKWRSLSFYANRFGLKTGEPDITGKEIGEAWAKGDYAVIERHCRLDVMTTARLAERLGLLSMAKAETVF